MSEYSQIIYYLQEKSTNCGMEVVYVISRIYGNSLCNIKDLCA